MLQSIIVYGIFAFSLWRLGNISAKREKTYFVKKKQPSFWIWDIVLALLIFAFISGIRWKVGVDHMSYFNGYEDLKKGLSFRTSGVEIGFEYISKLIASLDIHFTVYFGFLAFMQIFFIYYALKKEQYLLPFIGLVIIMGPEYLSWMNGIRQCLAACMFVFSIHFIKNRKLVPYFITILLATTIHKSAILLLIFYFIPQEDYFKNRYINISLLVASLIIGLNPSWLKAVDFAEKILAYIGYERYSEQFEIMTENRREMLIGPRRIVLLLLNIFTFWYAPKLKLLFKNTNYLIYFNFAFIGSILFNLFANTSHIFLRPVSYFSIFLAITTSYLLYYLKWKTRRGVSVSFILVLIVSMSYMLSSILADFGKGDMDWTNYKFFWDYVY